MTDKQLNKSIRDETTREIKKVRVLLRKYGYLKRSNIITEQQRIKMEGRW